MKEKDVPQHCRKCRFLTRIEWTNRYDYICYFIGVTGKARGCPIDEHCDRYEPSRKIKWNRYV